MRDPSLDEPPVPRTATRPGNSTAGPSFPVSLRRRISDKGAGRHGHRCKGRDDHRLIAGQLREGCRRGRSGGVEDTSRHHRCARKSISAEVMDGKTSQYRTSSTSHRARALGAQRRKARPCRAASPGAARRVRLCFSIHLTGGTALSVDLVGVRARAEPTSSRARCTSTV